MKFIKSNSSETGQLSLQTRLQEVLALKQNVLWLISGGSNIPITVAIMNELAPSSTQNLTIMLCDERYGPLNHQHSNLTALYKAAFKPKLAAILPVIQAGLSLEQTAGLYSKATQKAIDSADVVIGQLGIGVDGHTAGILPYSPAATADNMWVTSYKAADFSRITLTPFALSHVQEAYVFAFGVDKKAALTRLKQEMLPIAEQPAQLFRHLPTAYVYNDQIGE